MLKIMVGLCVGTKMGARGILPKFVNIRLWNLNISSFVSVYVLLISIEYLLCVRFAPVDQKEDAGTLVRRRLGRAPARARGLAWRE
jgi:hypothetical protein